MSRNLHQSGADARPPDRKRRMPAGDATAAPPAEDEARGPSAIEAFDEEGAGIAAKE